jgi:glutamyl-tRNA synthetase
MCEGKYAEREAVVRIKTDLNHPNPAVRDWPALRIIDVEKYPHPRVGKKYIVWPLFALCCGIDDYELEVSHILRGKEHLTNSERARFLYKYLGWEEPDAIHYGRLKMSGTVLSKSKIRDGIARGLYSNWDDPRLGTIKALRRRGFLPETIRNFILSVGPKPVDVTVSWPALESINRKLIDPLANRCFFVSNPIELIIDNVRKDYVCKQPRHPDHPERGSRTLKVSRRDETLILHISKNDLKLFKNNRVIRLMGLFNIKVKKEKNIFKAEFHSNSYREAKEMNAPLIHWLPLSNGIQTSVIMPDSTRVDGLTEDQCKPLEPYQIIQFERFGFARIDKVNDHLIAYYTHR